MIREGKGGRKAKEPGSEEPEGEEQLSHCAGLQNLLSLGLVCLQALQQWRTSKICHCHCLTPQSSDRLVNHGACTAANPG